MSFHGYDPGDRNIALVGISPKAPRSKCAAEKKEAVLKFVMSLIVQEKLQETDREIENKWAYVDGKKMEVSCYRIEPPRLFIGRGKHPKNGMLKRRINPSDVIINIVSPIWKKVVRDPHLKWLTYWKDSISGRRKYMNLKYCSSMFDISKFNTARELKINQAKIKQQYTVDFTSPNLVDKQCAIVTYLIDTLALRPGHVKDEQITAPTVGCCTLMVKNFRFTGKTSVDYENEVEVENLVFNCIKEFQLGE
ncbi:DNA topoisomerase 1 beta-like [Rosa rugosa]|uniref:DNA topoisomerase 1 beta-like n=1 Tax=Rosa rugosa TaxID=74645 RepID=UPI002B404B1A|nr:DNA topoisomerase 1 beta-like [Rosa rugosa]